MNLLASVEAVLADVPAGDLGRVGALANVSALLNERIADLNWVGFYLTDTDKVTLRLGPFQGRVACTTIAFGRGVCGSAAVRKESIRVADVSAFADHIVCDSASKSELVVPLITGAGKVVGVLDLDSPLLDRFTASDQEQLEAVAALIVRRLWA